MFDFDALRDFHSHARNWKDALEIAKSNSEPATVDTDDSTFWRHQIDVLNSVSAGLSPELFIIMPLEGGDNERRARGIWISAQQKIKFAESLGFNSNLKFHLTMLTAEEQAIEAFLSFHTYATGPGLESYVDEGHAKLTGKADRKAIRFIKEMAIEFEYMDAELSGVIYALARETNLYDNNGKDSGFQTSHTEVMEALEREYAKFDKERIFEFYLAAAESLDASTLPFRDGIRVIEREAGPYSPVLPF